MKLEAPFHVDFIPDAKAVEGEDALYVEGYASDFGFDREGEAFEPGAFDKGMKAFMERNPVLLYHHKGDKALGQVEEFEKRPDGLWIKARVDRPAPGSWAQDVWNKIKNRTIRSFSVGGFFKRRPGPDGKPRIHTADVAEVSITPLSVNPRTQFGLSPLAAAAGKAFDDLAPPELDLDAAVKSLTAVDEIFSEFEALLADDSAE